MSFLGVINILNIRTCVALVGALGVLFAPWWVPVACMLFLAIRYSAWEVLAIGLFIDLMWLPGQGSWILSMPLFTMGAIGVVWLLAPLRNEFLTH